MLQLAFIDQQGNILLRSIVERGGGAVLTFAQAITIKEIQVWDVGEDESERLARRVKEAL